MRKEKRNSSTTRKRLLIHLLQVLLFSIAFTQEKKSVYTFFPFQRLMPQFTANCTDHGFSVSKFLNKDHFWVGFGRSIPLVYYRKDNLLADVVGAGTVFTQLDHKPGSFRVINTDFYVDLYVTITWDSSTFFQIGAGHTSHHLNDDALEILGFQHSINYVRDYYRVFVLKRMDIFKGYIYGGFFYHHTFKVPSGKTPLWLFEVGADVVHTHITPALMGYMAFDIKFRDEVNFGSTQSYQAGVRISSASPYICRIALTHRTGYDERGQLYNTKVTIQSLGVYFDF
ncbi:MAG: DUF1207 domain-containing protein [Bacteroidetes bacterium]|nr:DUF1207 domain-containing protein [Bacteroidota bacterium]